jgi:hypothetical protein
VRIDIHLRVGVARQEGVENLRPKPHTARISRFCAAHQRSLHITRYIVMQQEHCSRNV